MLGISFFKLKKTEKNFDEKSEEIYSKSLLEVQNTPEYKLNAMQIDCIKRVLVDRADVPEKLVSWLIDAVKNNTVLEYSCTHNVMR